jgi:hypothetical protein
MQMQTITDDLNEILTALAAIETRHAAQIARLTVMRDFGGAQIRAGLGPDLDAIRESVEEALYTINGLPQPITAEDRRDYAAELRADQNAGR